MYKVKARSLINTGVIKEELQYLVSMVTNMDQGQRLPTGSVKSEVKILNIGMIDALCLEMWSEDMDSEITLVLELLDEQMNHIEINASIGGVGVGVWITDMEEFEDKWK